MFLFGGFDVESLAWYSTLFAIVDKRIIKSPALSMHKLSLRIDFVHSSYSCSRPTFYLGMESKLEL